MRQDPSILNSKTTLEFLSAVMLVPPLNFTPEMAPKVIHCTEGEGHGTKGDTLY